MATFFGEVLLNSTRAYDEFEEEYLLERYDVEVSLTEKFSPSVLILSFGSLANDFLENCAHSKKCKPVGTVNMRRASHEHRIDTGDFHPRVFTPSPFFLSAKGLLLCKVSEDITPKLANKMAKNILSLAEKSCPVVVLSSHHTSKLSIGHNVNLNKECHTFTVSSPSFSTPTDFFSRLPQPCVLDSLPAAVMTNCIVEDRPCVVYAAYTETTFSGDVDLVASDFSKVISQAPISNAICYDKKCALKYCRLKESDQYM